MFTIANSDFPAPSYNGNVRNGCGACNASSTGYRCDEQRADYKSTCEGRRRDFKPKAPRAITAITIDSFQRLIKEKKIHRGIEAFSVDICLLFFQVSPLDSTSRLRLGPHHLGLHSWNNFFLPIAYAIAIRHSLHRWSFRGLTRELSDPPLFSIANFDVEEIRK